jgi:hypothetical protein
MKLTEVNPDYFNRLRRLSAREKSSLSDLGVSNLQFSKRTSSNAVGSEESKTERSGRSRGEAIEAFPIMSLVQFRKHTDEEEERVWSHCQALDVQQGQYCEKWAKETNKRMFVEKGEIQVDDGKRFAVRKGVKPFGIGARVSGAIRSSLSC